MYNYSVWLSVNHIVQAGGLLAIAAVIFAEGAFLIGFFLPGDTLLIPAGIWASHHGNQLNVWLLLPTVIIASILGYQVGYTVGRRAGPKIFTRSGGILFRADYVPRTEAFLKQHGGKSIIVGRFVAVVRTLLPIMAGIGKMSTRKFLVLNSLGAIAWASVLILGSYWVGQQVNDVDKYIVWIVLIGLGVTVFGELWYVMRNAKSRQQLFSALREEYRYLIKRDSDS